MPRTLARLRFKAPPPPSALNLRQLNRPELLEHHVRNHVVRQTRPDRQLKLQIVVDPRAKPVSTGKIQKKPTRPHTLRDLVDPAHTARHGEIIYVFRNIRTNQIIYSLVELLREHHLDQLPFIGKHSKPPMLRADEWAPHCVITFPSPEQGHNAFRKLREFRRLHELCWDRTDPDLKSEKKKERIRRIMNQRANMSADLAEVLNLQEEHGKLMKQNLEQHNTAVREHLDKKWPEIHALAEAAKAKERPGDSVNWLENQVSRLTYKLGLKHNQNEADQKRLQLARKSHESRLEKIRYAQRKADQYKRMREELEAKAALANEEGAEARRMDLEDKIAALKKGLAEPSPDRTTEDLAADRALLQAQGKELAALDYAFAAKEELNSKSHYIAHSILPPPLRKQPPVPFTLKGLEIAWADMIDSERAKSEWPESIAHSQLPLRGTVSRPEPDYVNQEEFEAAIQPEIQRLVEAFGRRQGFEVAEGEGSEGSQGGDRLPLEQPAKSWTSWFRRAQA